MPGFAPILARAVKRKGGRAQLGALLPEPRPHADLARLPDDRVLAEMTRRIFCAGFVWRVIDQKWDGFEEAFTGFQIPPLLFQPPEFWEALTNDKRIVRHGQKIGAVRDITWREAGDEVRRMARWFQAQGWPQGSCVALLGGRRYGVCEGVCDGGLL